ncbi:hypothetical protein QBC46DRAFT_353501 [Diplogelasinospora grovesii]|uniref:Ribosomal protein S17 n=1 Tax=Diplogelasinospora grovesii TaxID=303347 RepID=A0AAN6S605_9PEZI|nr:hypothetical protein QBC46DRAFT_353501 [Diplogelasinospora grovesii]
MAASMAADVAMKTFRELHGVVVTAGLMQKTVKVRVGGQKWNNFLKKYFDDPKTYLVHDPNNSLRAGDVVAITPGWRTSKSKRHVVKHIIAPAGVPIEERPPVPTEEERWAAKLAEKAAKDERKALRKQIAAAQAALERAELLTRKAQREIRVRERLLGVSQTTGTTTTTDISDVD